MDEHPEMYFSLIRERGPFDWDRLTSAGDLDAVNSIGSKPTGGLWLSPIWDEKSTYWESYAAGTVHRESSHIFLRHSVELSESTRFAVVDSLDDLIQIAEQYPFDVSSLLPGVAVDQGILDSLSCYTPISWPAISADYDAFYLTANGQRETGCYLPDGIPRLNGWDMESIVVLNRESVKSVSEPVLIDLSQ